jgi:hypothetical protein
VREGNKAIAFFKAVAEGPPEGMELEALAERLHLAGTRGLGGLLGSAKSQLDEFGILLDEAITRGRSRRGRPTWAPGPRIVDAISRLERKAERGGAVVTGPISVTSEAAP